MPAAGLRSPHPQAVEPSASENKSPVDLTGRFRAVVRRTIGYRRFEGLEAAATLARLYAAMRLFVNFFQPSFQLATKVRDGALVRKRYHPPATPCQRLIADPRTREEVRRRVLCFMYLDG